MVDYPETVLQFRDQFATEAACREFIAQVRWPNGPQCLCGSTEVWHRSRGLFLCTKCRRDISVTAGTLFADTHQPLRLWFEAMWHVTSQKYGASALGLQRILGLGSYHTAWNWLQKLRRAMVRPGRDRLAGTIEVDEIFIGGVREGKRGRGAEGKALVLVAAQQTEHGIGRIRLHRVADASQASLEPAVRETVEPGSTVKTDGWASYNGLELLGYKHEIVHPAGEQGDNLLPMVNRVASLVKRWLLGTHQGAVEVSHLDYYLDEYVFRFNRRTAKSRGLLFMRLVQQAIQVSPIRNSTLHVKTQGMEVV